MARCWLKTLDRLQAVLANAENARIIISNVEATLPVIEDDADPGKGKTKGIALTREELLNELPGNAVLVRTIDDIRNLKMALSPRQE